VVDLGGITLIVTGLPRSGTSTIMRMLEFGGVKTLSDSAKRKQNSKHNPYGIWELGDVGTEIKANPKEWTANQAVKIVTPYSVWYPVDRPLKAIFMQRSLSEIISSLLTMKTIWGEDLVESLKTGRETLERHNVPILFVKYHDMVDFPKTTALRVQDFLGVELDIENMVKAVDKNARNRHKEDSTVLGHGEPDKIIDIDREEYLQIKIRGKPQPLEPQFKGDIC